MVSRFDFSPPSLGTIAAGFAGGVGNAAVVLGLYARADYPALESVTGTAVLALGAFVVGFVPLFLAAYTRLFAPAVGLLAAVAGTVALELTSAMPEWGTRGGEVIVDGPTHIGSYANTWYVWLALAAVVAVAEFGIRRQYGIADGRLRNVPERPLQRADRYAVVLGTAALVGLATSLLVVRPGVQPSLVVPVVFAFAVAATAVPLAALFEDGALVPLVLFAFVPYLLVLEVFVTTDSPVHILLFGPYAVVLAVVWLLERTARRRLGGTDGGSTGERPA
ncbi:hypothetical protein [Natronobacterium gregoryi]|uniref:Uncharacterized protein n=2 Tax=Natronobacterium gregoryi TaxID=44930 RepID=L0ALQ3_NATGS|nr:hypothetical protein [Natronobacterium gregoryi]AFZ74721.1 hypothetical protein Natgr_3608 [Natronobacterium gregoryi SP2]ELY73472.1 hypothetical protein C490_01365 [Natronobacterium gregoryi SP2]PLK20965.1 hypothetical protein CYV19_06805 [Natronobacterium gregoryi SP2]SFJ04086.1 hypothetical protein SAMN05443661_11236 [Natronobacterium gregoryi]